MGTPKSLSMKYSNPIWHEYNLGLSRLVEPGRSKGPTIAPGCGHFIQRDNPSFVVQETLELLDRLRDSNESHQAVGLSIEEVRQREESADVRNVLHMT